MPPSPVPEPPRVERHLVAGRLVRSHVVGHETGSPPLVLVPGLGALGYLLPTVRECAAWTRVHLLDLPGFGSRSTAHLLADLGTLAEVLAAWLRAVPGRPVLLVGHSTGAQVALLASLAVPDGVHALALAGATFPPSLRTLPVLAAAVVRTGPHERTGELPAVLPYYLRGAQRLPQLLSSALSDRPEESVPQLSAPVHVLHGRHDGLCPPTWATRLAGLAPHGTAHPLPGCHNTPWTHPVETAAALREAS